MPAPANSSLSRAALPVLLFVVLLWLIKLLEWAGGWDLVGLGVYPGSVRGLVGLLAAPLIHGSWSHLFSNTLPLLILGTSLFYGYPRSRFLVLLVLYLGSGLLVWLFARPVYHIGASGLNHGLMFFIFVSGILRRDRRSIALALMVFFLYGGMVWSVFPGKPGVSFEFHLAGAVLGVLLAYLLRNWDRPEPQTYSWEHEAEDGDDLIGEAWRAGDEPDAKKRE